jgi:general secretion pathway protein J
MNYLVNISSMLHQSIQLSTACSALCSFRSLLRPGPCTLSHETADFQKPTDSCKYPISSIRQPATCNPHPDSGFTLMEILLAFLILAIVVSTILGSFNAVFSTTDTLDNSGKYYAMAKNCLNRMSLDLNAVYVTQPPYYKKPEFDDPPDSYRIEGSVVDVGGIDFAKLRFTSSAHIPLDNTSRGGIAEIVYYVQSKTDGQLVLKRADHLYPYPPFEEKGSDPVLCQHVKSLAFKYFDAEGQESEEWNSDAADYDHATPKAIGIQLEIGNESNSYTFETTVLLAAHRQKLE